MKAAPTWFGPVKRPLFGWFHLPEVGTATGVAVLCGPLGREGANALWAMQAAADQLAERGVAALRFAYAGTGDSAGSLDDPGQVTEWVDSIGEAVAFARRSVVGPVVLIGMRMGALLAAEAVSRGTPVDGLVQWDPCGSGRAFFRVEQTLLAAGYGAAQIGDGSVAGPAFLFSAETVGDLTSLTLSPCDTAAVPRTLVLARTGDRSVAAARERFSPPAAEWVEIEGQRELLDVPPDMTTLPVAAIDDVARWTCGVLDAPPAVVDFVCQASADVAGSSGGPEISEHPAWLGPNSLFGMVAEPAGTGHPTSPTVLFLSAGALDHTGPGRMWVDLARRFAGSGIRSIRVDLDGIGETFGRPGQERNIPKPPEAIDDLCDLAVALGDPEATDLVFIGLSSGGYHAIEAGLRLHPRAVCAINPGLASWVPEEDRGEVDPRRRAYRPMPVALRSLAVSHARIARWTWRGILQVWVNRSPTASVAGVARRGIPVLLITSEDDSDQFETSPYWSAARHRLARRGLLDVEVVAGSDHSLYTSESQDKAYAILSNWVVSRYGSRPPST